MRIAIFLAIVAAIFLPLNFAVVRALWKIHPRRRLLTISATVLANLMWPFLPLLNTRTPLLRVLRAVLGPPWFSWLIFLILYGAFLLLLALAWLAARRRQPFTAFAHVPSTLFLIV